MNKIIYKTQPRLFILSMTFLAFVFFGLLFLLTILYSQSEYDLFALTGLVFFATLSLASLFYFLSIKTIKLTKDNVIISYLLLPIKKTHNLQEIKSMVQTEKEVSAVVGSSLWKSSHIYTDITTLITLSDSRTIKLNSIGHLDFEEFHQTFNKLKREEGKIKDQKRHFLLYLLDNLNGIAWIILTLIMTTGLAYGIFMQN